MNPLTEFLIFIVFIILISFLFNYFTTDEYRYPENIVSGIKYLIDKSIHWNNLSKQDNSELIALTHANYAFSLIMDVRHLVSSEYIKDKFGINLNELMYDIQQTQRSALSNITKKYPGLGTGTMYSSF